jgi:hypothetical protein
MALETGRIPYTIGVPLSNAAGTGIFTLNSATKRVAFSFVAWQGKTLDSVRFYCAGLGGSPIAADAVCDLFSDSAAGVPGSSIVSKTADANPANNAWSQWSAFSQALTAGTRYWLVMRNANAVPATNNFGWQHAAAATVGGAYGSYQTGTQGWGTAKLESSDSGTTWGAVNLDGCIMRIKYSDATYDGTGIQSVQTMAAASCVFDKREVGSVFTVPTGLNAYVRRLSMAFGKNGTPSGAARFRIYRGTTLLATSYTIPVGNVATGMQLYEQAFSSSILINAGDTIRVVVGVAVTGDTSTNRYNIQDYTVENDANSKALKPFDGTISRTETADNTGTTWTDTDTSYIPFLLGLDTNAEFAAGGGAGYPASRSFLGA